MRGLGIKSAVVVSALFASLGQSGGSLTLSTTGARADTPNASFEDSWYEINQRETFHPISGKEWKSLIGERESEEYQVQPGDTLWGLSKTFFGNGYFWPKLWQVNSQFENPHEISPGQTIRFISGGGEAPELSMDESDDGADNSLQASEEQDTDDDIVIATDDGEVRVPGEPQGHKVLKEIPRSLPNISRFLTNARISSAGIYLEKDFVIREDVEVPVPYFATKHEPVSIGRVVGIAGGELSGSWRGTVYIKIDPGSAADRGGNIATGTLMRTFRDSDILKDPTNHRLLGREFDLSSDLEMIGSTNEENVYQAKVRSSIDEVKVGDYVGMGQLPRFRISKKDPVVETAGRVVGIPFRQEGKGEGSSHYVFLNIGSVDGVKANDHIPVFGVSTRLKNGNELYEPRGEIIIMSVSENLSAGVVWKSNMIVRVGDMVGRLVKKTVKATAEDKQDPLKQ